MHGLMRGKRAKPSNLLYNILQYITTLDKKMDTLTDKVKSNEEQIQLVQSTIDELLLQEGAGNCKDV